ncbi:hypothetical protein GW814_03390, partial [Candidatus Falkowbacteria bacterium]|nr:hypothetical protein [Candidatus Falkowbacteria bacterium]
MNQYSKPRNLVKGKENNLTNTVEVGGIAPPDSRMTSRSPHYATPTADSLYHKNQTAENLKNAVWTKVAELAEGDEIAVADLKSDFKEAPKSDFGNVIFVKIVKIELLPAEQVYDIEVEGTHNFVGNGIIAHNTYISGNVGIGDVAPGTKLSIVGTAGANDMFDVASSTGTSVLRIT